MSETPEQISALFSKLAGGAVLTAPEARGLFRAAFEGKIARREIRTLLLLLAARGETVPEIDGCRQAIRDLEPPEPLACAHLMDTCGTGGDGRRTFNISTVAALVAAGAGGRIAKHGNRAITSQCGSSDLMEALGVSLGASRECMMRSIEEHGIGYFHAPNHHPVFMRMHGIRTELKRRTIFNLLGPLLNPLEIRYQLMGVPKETLVPAYAALLSRSGLEKAVVCHSTDGLDEISSGAPSRLAVVLKGKVRYQTLDPAAYGFSRCKPDRYRGGDVSVNRGIALDLLEGRGRGPILEVILLNAAVALWISEVADTIEQGLAKAEQAVRSGQAREALAGLVRSSNKP
ncbi:MAG: anthranilate phosphoribosyltransferase [Candidatus Omnitrophota bacterium]